MAAVDNDAVFVMVHRACERAVDRIVFEEIGQSGIVRAGIDGGEAYVLIVGHDPQKIASDTAETVHPQCDGHKDLLWSCKVACRAQALPAEPMT